MNPPLPLRPRLARFYGQMKAEDYRDVITVGRKIEPKDLENVLRALKDAIIEYNRRFTAYALFVKDENDRPAISALIEIMAGVRVSWNKDAEKTKSSPPSSASDEPTTSPPS